MSEDELKENEYQEHREFIKDCDKAQDKNIQSQDKIVIAISSGLFGLLLTILDKNLLNENQICAFKALLASNAATLILALLAFSAANKAINEKVQVVSHKKDVDDFWESVTNQLNLGYLLTTCLTIIFLTAVMWNFF